jgi:hypothetical protein
MWRRSNLIPTGICKLKTIVQLYNSLSCFDYNMAYNSQNQKTLCHILTLQTHATHLTKKKCTEMQNFSSSIEQDTFQNLVDLLPAYAVAYLVETVCYKPDSR